MGMFCVAPSGTGVQSKHSYYQDEGKVNIALLVFLWGGWGGAVLKATGKSFPLISECFAAGDAQHAKQPIAWA